MPDYVFILKKVLNKTLVTVFQRLKHIHDSEVYFSLLAFLCM